MYGHRFFLKLKSYRLNFCNKKISNFWSFSTVLYVLHVSLLISLGTRYPNFISALRFSKIWNFSIRLAPWGTLLLRSKHKSWWVLGTVVERCKHWVLDARNARVQDLISWSGLKNHAKIVRHPAMSAQNYNLCIKCSWYLTVRPEKS